MNTELCKLLGVDFPLVAFSHCRDVVVAASKAGAFGVFGGATISPEQFKIELDWIDAHIDGKPYGVDLAIPENMPVKDAGHTAQTLMEHIPDEIYTYVNDLLDQHGLGAISASSFARHGTNHESGADDQALSLMPDTAQRMIEEAFRHPIKLIVNALGLPPQLMFDLAHEHGVPVGATIGSVDHARRHLDAGVDVLVAMGVEGAAHCGEISSMVLIAEVVEGIKAIRSVPVIAAGGIVTGRQMAAAMTLGAQGVWTGSVWLPTVESEVNPIVKEKLLAARSRDTVRSKALTGKQARHLKSAWSEAWETDDGPQPLQMPYQSLLNGAAQAQSLRSAEVGNRKALYLLTEAVGQGVGMLNSSKSVRSVVQEFREDFADAIERMHEILA